MIAWQEAAKVKALIGAPALVFFVVDQHYETYMDDAKVFADVFGIRPGKRVLPSLKGEAREVLMSNCSLLDKELVTSKLNAAGYRVAFVKER